MAEGDPTVTPPSGFQGPVGSPNTPGPIQLEKAWHGLMYEMAVNEVKRVKTVNAVVRHTRHSMRTGRG